MHLSSNEGFSLDDFSRSWVNLFYAQDVGRWMAMEQSVHLALLSRRDQEINSHVDSLNSTLVNPKTTLASAAKKKKKDKAGKERSQEREGASERAIMNL